MNARQTVLAVIFREVVPSDRLFQMLIYGIFTAVEIRDLFMQVFRVARFLHVFADGKDEPHGRVGIDIRFQIGIPGQYGVAVRILMRHALVDDRLRALHVVVQHRHTKLGVVAHRFFAERTETHLFFRPKIHDAFDPLFGASCAERIAGKARSALFYNQRCLFEYFFARRDQLLFTVAQSDDIMKSLFLFGREHDFILQDAAPRCRRASTVAARLQDFRFRDVAERPYKFFIIAVIGKYGQFGGNETVAAFMRLIRIQQTVVHRVRFRQIFRCRGRHRAVIYGLRIPVQIERGRCKYAQIARSCRLIFQSHLSDLVRIRGRHSIGDPAIDAFIRRRNFRKLLPVHTAVTLYGDHRRISRHVPVFFCLFVANINETRLGRVDSHLDRLAIQKF